MSTQDRSAGGSPDRDTTLSSADSVELASAADRLLRALVAPHRTDAESVVRQAYQDGHSATRVVEHVIFPAMAEIGARWAQGKLSIAQEHNATRICLGASELLRLQATRRPLRGARALVCGVRGNTHELGAKLIADLLYLDGWEVDFLGGDTPPEAIVTFAVERRPRLLGLAVHQPDQVPALEQTVEGVRRAVDVFVMVGGPSASLANHVAADAFAADGTAALRIARRAVATDPEPALPGYLVSIGAAIRTRRKGLKWSQAELAKRAELDRTYVSALERGRQNPSIATLYRVAEALDVPINALLMRRGAPPALP